jgi:hypothetical protein
MGTPITGLTDLCRLFIDTVSAGVEIPKSRLFQNQSGILGGDQGKNDLRIHYDNVASYQKVELAPKLRRLLDIVLAPHGFAPGEIHLEFNSLWQLSELEDADVRLKVAQADTAYVGMGAIEPEEVGLSRFSGDGINLDQYQVDADRLKTILKRKKEQALNPPEVPTEDEIAALLNRGASSQPGEDLGDDRTGPKGQETRR